MVTHKHLNNSFRNSQRHGLTLVEMLVSVALTLMVVFALVSVFQLLGSNVTDGRATIEMSSNLRTAADLLRKDLEGLTVRSVLPPGKDQGYFEIVDGIGTDTRQYAVDGSGQQQLAVDLAQVATDEKGFPVPSTLIPNVPFDSSVGDVDDILAFTSRRSQQPFTGIVSEPRIRKYSGPIIQNPGLTPTLLLESNEAEVVWYVRPSFNTEYAAANIGIQITNGAGGLPQLYPNGTPVRSLHRRVLLIRPDLDLSHIVIRSMREVITFLNTNDLSVRVVRLDDGSFRLISNSLKDLAQRENRAYRGVIQGVPAPPSSLPYDVYVSRLKPAVDPLQATSEIRPTLLGRDALLKDLLVPVQDINGANYNTPMLRKGKDVVLSDVMGFDIQVWDPHAVVRITPDGNAVTPSDPGYVMEGATNASRGAYVDLGFGFKLDFQENEWLGLGHFAKKGGPVTTTPSLFPTRSTYCTWSTSYESDGLDQDPGKFVNGAGDSIVDQGTNGLDDTFPFSGGLYSQGGVDDWSEAETRPPFSNPLNGMKVSLRIMDSSTRQVRQTDVIHDFVAE